MNSERGIAMQLLSAGGTKIRGVHVSTLSPIECVHHDVIYELN